MCDYITLLSADSRFVMWLGPINGNFTVAIAENKETILYKQHFFKVLLRTFITLSIIHVPGNTGYIFLRFGYIFLRFTFSFTVV
jgi:hypothetical protein